MTVGERCQPMCSGAKDPTSPHRQRHATEQPQLRFYPTGESEECYPGDAGHSKAGVIQRVSVLIVMNLPARVRTRALTCVLGSLGTALQSVH